ncbi:unnamed protein product [Adineta ricciae]|uniref:Uncharacterized protein n=1 Tax=Adineta ricciae TaxID=249248 RepID=A0A813TBA1_ADIRI|nr:unnamed protein product [Adineta ricciae]CAF1225033.1 unnamed protein product [Adineta ricciae]
MSDKNHPQKDRPRFVYDHSPSGALPPNVVGTESSKYTVLVKHIPASRFGTLRAEPYITQSTEKLRKLACLTFTEQAAVESCMNGDRQSYNLNGYPISVQRYLPAGLTFTESYRLLLSFIETSLNVVPTEDDIRSYFETNYGKVKAFAWTSEHTAMIDFEDYDAVDRAVLNSIIHTINGANIRLEKVKSSFVRATYLQPIADGTRYCVRVRNIPSHVSGERLATAFNSNVWDVLIRKGRFLERDPMEAWILNIPTMFEAEQLALSVTDIDEVNIQCEAMKEPINEWTLCSGNRDGWCKHDRECIYRHITCVSGDECKNEECPFSHSKQRKIIPVPRYRPAGPVEQQYRIKIDGIPYNMTPTELVVELKKQPPSLVKFIEAPEVPKGSTTRHFYVTRQAAEKLARTRVFQWHNYPIRESYIVKCQLEYDRIATTDHLSAAVEADIQTNNQRLRSMFAPLSPGPKEINGMPSKWIWTNRLLSNETSRVYLVYPSELADDRLGAMKLFRPANDLDLKRAKRELLALKVLENSITSLNNSVVVHVYQSNVLDATRKKGQPLWIITQITSELTLEDYVNQYKSQVTFENILNIICQLLELIQQCHKHHIIHRNLQPRNVLVARNQDRVSSTSIKLTLIDFSVAWFDHQQKSTDDQDDLKIIEQAIDEHSSRTGNNMCNILQRLLMARTAEQRRDSSIDSLSICYILFWLLTEEWPDCVNYTGFPHRDDEKQQKIHEKLGEFQNTGHIRQQIMHIFDRSFDPSDKKWSVDELWTYLNEIHKSMVDFEAAHLHDLFPLIPNITSLAKDDQYARFVTLIAFIKQRFIQQYSSCVKWSNSGNKWSNKNKDIEVKNTDELTYGYQDRHCSTPIICLVQFDLEPATFFVGSMDSMGTMDLKILCNVEKGTDDMDVSMHFDLAVKRLVRDKLKQDYSLL